MKKLLIIVAFFLSRVACAQIPTPSTALIYYSAGGIPTAFTSMSTVPLLITPSQTIYVACQNSSGQAVLATTAAPCVAGNASGGTVTSFSSGNLAPLFTTSVATSTSTPALSFALTAAPANSVLGNPTGSPAAPSYTSAPVVTTLGVSGGSASTALAVSGTSNTALPGLIGVTDATTGATINYGSSYLAPNLPTGAAVDWVWGKANLNGNAFVLAWNQTASTATNNWCLTTWGLGATCNLQGFLSGAVKSALNTLDDGLGNATFKTIAPPTMLTGDITATPSFSQFVTSTNSGGTAGIPAGLGCTITHSFSTGVTYSAEALCVNVAGGLYYTSPARNIGSEVWSRVWSSSGTSFIGNGVVVGTNIFSGESSITSSTTAIPINVQLTTVTLAANYTFTMAAGAAGQSICVQFLEGATGGFAVTQPANVLGFTAVAVTPNNRSMQCFIYSTVNTAWTAKSVSTQGY